MKTFLEEKLEELHKEHAEKEQEIKDAIRKERALDISSEVIRVATILHEKLCHSNHADACDWFYDNGDWSSWSRKKYVDQAKTMLAVSSIEDVLKILTLL